MRWNVAANNGSLAQKHEKLAVKDKKLTADGVINSNDSIFSQRIDITRLELSMNEFTAAMLYN